MPEARPLVVVSQPIHPAGIEILEAYARVVIPEEPSEAAVMAVGVEAEALLIRTRPVLTESLMASLKRLRCVARYGTGLDNVDLEAATRLGLPVLYAPGRNADAVAEHALMLMLAVAKRLLPLDAGVRRGEWADLQVRGIGELRGLTLGLIGVGNIGRRVARLAGAFGMEVLGYDPHVSAEELKRRGAKKVELDDLLRRADVVSLHCPLTPETRHILGREAIARLKPGAVVINTARGGTVDQAALIEALESGKVAGAGLDVLDPEPPEGPSPLFVLDRVVLTPHVAGVSERANRAIASQVATDIVKVLRGGRPSMVANPEVLAPRP